MRRPDESPMRVHERRWYVAYMLPSLTSDRPTELLNAAERDLIRRELCVRFGRPPALVEGIFLRVWRSGPLAGQPKIPAAVQSMVDRGLMVVSAGSPHMARAHFTDEGLEALRWLAAQRRELNPAQFAHVRQELGQEASQADG